MAKAPGLSAAHLLVRCLEKEGVKYVFGIPGEENIHLVDALNGSSIRFIPARHEQGAAFPFRRAGVGGQRVRAYQIAPTRMLGEITDPL